MEVYSLSVLLLLASACSAQVSVYRVCTDASAAQCSAVQLGGSRVECVRAETKVDCALQLAAETAHFAVFSEEEVLLLAQRQPGSHAVVASLRHDQKLDDTWAFESVAVVRTNHTGGLQGLTRSGFCHPGYQLNDQRWSPRVLHYFEDQVAQTSRDCDPEAKTPAGSQASALSRFFAKACRPGPWTEHDTEDALLKSKYKTLCELCQNQNCNNGHIAAGVSSSHQQALQCVTDYGGDVTYVAWHSVKQYFAGRADVGSYALLCEDGSTQPLSTQMLLSGAAPCSWQRQPWSAIVASRTVSANLLAEMKTWFPNGRADASAASWTRALDAIVFHNNEVRAVFDDSTPSPIDYVTPGRGPLGAFDSATSGCHRAQRWCTISAAETLKCEWIRQAAISLGVQPAIECVQQDSEIACLNNIQMDRADFISLDSNYGYLARKHYQLSTVLYHQTQRQDASRVVALLKNNPVADNATIQRFENLRGKTACFPEYGGIAWVSFVRAAHERRVISESECVYSAAVAEFFGSACAPGASETSHTTSTAPTTLCGACRRNPNFPGTVVGVSTPTVNDNPFAVVAPTVTADIECASNYSNMYFGTNGTLACIAAPHTDVAFIETQYLNSIFAAQNLDPNNFRVLCRNNSLALHTGVNVDDACLLSYTVDGEVLARRNWEQTVALKSLFFMLDNLFGYDVSVNQLINFKIYSPFNGVSNLLFRDSVISVADSNSTVDQVKNYEDLFRHLDACSAASPSPTTISPPAAAARVIMPVLAMAMASLLARLLN